MSDYAAGSPAYLALQVVAHKWTLLIVFALQERELRFSELRRRVPGVTPQVLADSLRALERDGIVSRWDLHELPPHVEYRLTALGASLCEPAKAIRAWAEEHAEEVIEARRRFDRRPSR
jgi:DNA-binding HxlR family transcriptional regulator